MIQQIYRKQFLPAAASLLMLLLFLPPATLRSQTVPSDGNPGPGGQGSMEVAPVPMGGFEKRGGSALYPTITEDGSVMVFNYKGANEKYFDLYITYKRDGSWSYPVPLREVNSRFNDETPYLTPDGSTLFFSSDRNGSMEFREGSDTRISYDLYRSRREKGGWSRPERIPGDVNTVHHERFPSLSPDGKTLYYSTWPFGELMRSRLARASFKGGAFHREGDLPEIVNSGNQEVQFLPARDMGGFFFSSRREGGLGGYDLYFISQSKEGLGIPVNLGSDINSDGQEISLTRGGGKIYFTSNRDGKSFKIYSSRWVRSYKLRFLVKDKKSDRPLSVTARIVGSSFLDDKGARIDKKSDQEGKFSIEVDGRIRRLQLRVDEEGYLPYLEQIDPALQEEDRPVLVVLTPLKRDASFDVHAIHFAYNSAVLTEDSYPFLDSLADYLKKHPKIRLEIVGHTDMVGSAWFNRRLSLQRAKSVKDYLVEKGIKAKRFEVTGAGKSHPLVEGTGPGKDELNRRTEFKILND